MRLFGLEFPSKTVKANAVRPAFAPQPNGDFLFNLLQPISSAGPVITQKAFTLLSHITRYNYRYSCSPFVPLAEELGFLEDYINLIKLGMPETLVVFFVKPDVVCEEVVPPMLLLPFIENAFRYGVKKDEVSIIYILIACLENTLKLEVKYSFFDRAALDFMNIRRQLDLRCPSKYKLSFREDSYDQQLIVHLNLYL
jgi:LytS/YehU family sensor histidine kinase